MWILALVEMLKETHVYSKTNFIKDLSFDTLPRQNVKFLPYEYNRVIMFESPRRPEYHLPIGSMNLLFGMDRRFDGHV